MSRKFFVGGNFKLNPSTIQQRDAIIDSLNNEDLDPNTEVVIAPPTLYLLPLQGTLRKDIALSAQNAYIKESGAFTGEISPAQLADAGIPFVILGHSERRTLFHETSQLVADKTRAALDNGLNVILCIGETKQERAEKRTAEICTAQLAPVIDVLKGRDQNWRNIVIAYEPVWAIGTGETATAAQAQDAHAFVRSQLPSDVANIVRIIYGGSVTAKNCRELATQPDVDGFLVGGASLQPQFVNIINCKLA